MARPPLLRRGSRCQCASTNSAPLIHKSLTQTLNLTQVSAGSLKKTDPKFKVYLGLCSSEDEPADNHSHAPPPLAIAFARETWLMPRGKHNDYRRTTGDGPRGAIVPEAVTCRCGARCGPC